MRDFVVPKTDTKVLGKVSLVYAFTLTARYDPPQESRTPRGTFRYRDIVSGELSGEQVKATVYPDSGGQYDTVRADLPRVLVQNRHPSLAIEACEELQNFGLRNHVKRAGGLIGDQQRRPMHDGHGDQHALCLANA